ncbi:MAG: bacillithiol biosynthesis cysteine-adding enzyme BshC [Flavobacteriales bacterium]|nr:bacillithiol biosynthesis cysteine-adding enzyme BshC [Flavobacteriales bacterium]
MNHHHISIAETDNPTPLVRDYISNSPQLQPFYNYRPDMDGLRQAASDISNRSFERTLLVEAIQAQYDESGIQPSHAVKKHLDELMHPSSLTVTTGHQLCLMGGPLYFIYKITSAIQLAHQLREDLKVPVIPVFWMATEDHDFEEIRSFHLFGKTLTWETDAHGPVGRLKLNGINAVLDELTTTLGDQANGIALKEIFSSALTRSDNMAQFTRHWVHSLFKDQGLVILDADHPSLKNQFSRIMAEDATTSISLKLVEQTSETLSKYYKLQVTPRPVNLFYIGEGDRERVLAPEETGAANYSAGKHHPSLTANELAEMIRQQPENFSPNVILRPLYQQVILPNIAYVGGGAEVAYWMQLKSVFDHCDVFFPALILRDSAWWIDSGAAAKLEKLGLVWNDLLKEESTLIKTWLEKNAETEVDYSKAKNAILEIFDKIAEDTKQIDQSLEKAVGAEGQKAMKILEGVESRIQKAAKKKYETSLKQIEQLRRKLYPEGQWQERHDNFIPLYLKLGPEMIPMMLKDFNPLSHTLKVWVGDHL